MEILSLNVSYLAYITRVEVVEVQGVFYRFLKHIQVFSTKLELAVIYLKCFVRNLHSYLKYTPQASGCQLSL